MAVKNATTKVWALTPSFDGLKYSAWPGGDKPAGYQTMAKLVGTDIIAVTLANNYNGLGSWFSVLGYGLGKDADKGTAAGAIVQCRDPLDGTGGGGTWYNVAAHLKLGKARSYAWTQLMELQVQIGPLGGSQVNGRPLDVRVVVNGTPSNVLTGRLINQGPRDFYFVSPTGNDATGVKNDPNHPYRWIMNASGGTYLGIWAVIQRGDTIVPRGNAGTWTDQLAACNFRWLQLPWGPAFPVTTGTAPTGAAGTGYYTIYGYPGEDVHHSANNGGGIHGCDSARAQAGSGQYVQVAQLRFDTQGGSARDAGGVNYQSGADHWQVGCIEFGPWIAGASAILNCSGIGGQCSNTEEIDCYVHDVQGTTDLQNHGFYKGGVAGGTGYNNATFNTKTRYCVASNISGGSGFQWYWQEGQNSNMMTGNSADHCWAENTAKYGFNYGESGVSANLSNLVARYTGWSAFRVCPPNGQTPAIHWEHCNAFAWNQVHGSTSQVAAFLNEGYITSGSVSINHSVFAAPARGGAYSIDWYSNNGAGDANLTASQNVYWDPDGVKTTAWSIDAAGIFGDPKFVDAINGNFTCQAGGAGVDAVTTAVAFTVSDDFYGIARPQGVRNDIGAFEGIGT